MFSKCFSKSIRFSFNTLSKRKFYVTQTEHFKPLITGKWLEAHLDREYVKVVDGSWYLPKAQRDPVQEYETERIPGAIYFDLNEIRDKNTTLPRMMPSAEEFELAMAEMSITNKDLIIVYDGMGIFSACRVWYMLRAMGCKYVAILDGGFPLWKQEGRKIETGEITGSYQSNTEAYTAKYNRSSIANYRDIQKIISGVDQAQIVDARSHDRFLGNIKETKPGLRSGHIPTSMSLHFKQLLTDDGLCFRPLQEIRQLFKLNNIDIEKPIVTSCGSGVTAAIVSFAIHMLHYEDSYDGDETDLPPPLRLYDGSWSEWGANEAFPIAAGESQTYTPPPNQD